MNSGGKTSDETGNNSMKAPSALTHARINQRQDSNISSDSYSMMSSPDYILKNKEPQKANKSRNNHQNSAESFAMSNKNLHRSTYGAYPKRQDSSISCESQSSSPSSKLLDAPLLAHAAKMSSCKFFQLLH